MSEETNSGIDLGVSAPSIEDRMQAFVNNEPTLTADDQAQQPQTAQQDAPQDQAQSDELTADDLPDESEAAPSAGETVFEILHNGQTHKITSRDEAVKYIQQGFDYTQKTQALAQERSQLQQSLQRLAEVEQVQPLLAQELSYVNGLQTQLQSARYSDQEMLRLAREDFVEHAQRSEERNALRNQLQVAGQQFQHKAGLVSQYRQQLMDAQLQQEAARLPEVVPAWRDPAKLNADKTEMGKYLESLGVDMGQVGRYLDNAVAMKIVHQSRLYENLVRSKADKSKQLRTVPPVPKPGSPSSAQAESSLKARDIHKKVGTRESAASLLLTRMKG